MNNFKILDHPADIGILASGKSEEELFISAALGTVSLIIDPESVTNLTNKKIYLRGKNIEDIFTCWLDEIIYLFDSEGFLLSKITNFLINHSKDEYKLQAEISGEKLNKDKHKLKLYLKAVTYHQLEIKKLNDNSWQAKVYFDV